MTSEEVTLTGTIIQSPNHPGKYDNNIDCVIMIRLSLGEVVSLQFLSRLDLPGDWVEFGCDEDFLEIRDGDTSDSKLIEGYKCGSYTPSDMKSTGNTMYIRFHTNENITGNGFRMKVDAGM